MPTNATIDELVAACHQTALEHGFWEEWEDAQWLEDYAVKKKNSHIGMASDTYEHFFKIAKNHRILYIITKLMLIVSEAAESLEALRDEHPDDFSEELIDILIRDFDLLGKLGIETSTVLSRKMAKNETRPYRHGKVL